jgi:hypothetical protein
MRSSLGHLESSGSLTTSSPTTYLVKCSEFARAFPLLPRYTKIWIAQPHYSRVTSYHPGPLDAKKNITVMHGLLLTARRVHISPWLRVLRGVGNMPALEP